MTVKKIIINLNTAPDAKGLTALNELNSFFNDRDFNVDLNDNRLIVNLRAIDLKQFSLIKKTVQQDCGKENAQMLNQIEDSINAIKSYGIKNGKRIYVDYNKERKVKNRVMLIIIKNER